MLTASDGPRGLAVLGSPIAHSQSPALHAAAYRELGLPWSYDRAEVTPATLGDYVQSRPDDWRGLSLTMPLKQSVLPLVSSMDEIARLTGAANTILFDTDASGRRELRGFNTDVIGIVRALTAAGTSNARSVLVWGGGATAASAVVAAAELGADVVTVQVREPARAEQLIGLGHAVGLRVEIRSFQDEVSERPDLVISTLPGSAGADGGANRIVRGKGTARAAADGILLLDVAYDPWPTEVVKVWDARGGAMGRTASHNVLSGLAMLVHQALLQVRIFVTGDPERELPDEPAVLGAMLAAVGLDASGRPV
ncbi:shikimate dehydrogenase [Planctomonas sp. JC2975]|uniref:shikimate dehydrogenase family protein n=1 Tax=Planctomonas sp. JC2975 TaxID=2729626 RepID=UPI00147469A6|nr:shikimate dehydrogenase [Planctomonas sp. JC2975]NNC10599.1 shikimate dehydrogenase [Planctomonas sp. JC2975]